MQRRDFLHHSLGAVGASLIGSAALANDAVSRIIVGFAPGGPGDILARLMADRLKKPLGMTVIVENRPGASGRMAITEVKGARADGTTLLNTPASVLTLLPHAFKGGDFKPLNDLAPVCTMSELDFAIVAGAHVPANTLADWIKLCRTDAQYASVGTPGNGTPQHMVAALLGRAAEVPVTHVPYRGAAPALQDAIGGALPVAIGTLSELMMNARREGRVKILATCGGKRSAFLPDVPTVAEAGVKDIRASDWSGLLAPAQTSAEVRSRLSKVVLEVVASAEYRQALARLHMEPLALDTAAYAERLKVESAAWGPVVKSTGFTMDS